MEKRGLGFNLIYATCQENRNPEPKIIEVEDAVKVVLYRSKLGTIPLPEYANDLSVFMARNEPFVLPLLESDKAAKDELKDEKIYPTKH